MTLLRLTLLVLALGLAVESAWGQGSAADSVDAAPDTVAQRVSAAFLKGNAQHLLTPATNRVEISLFGTRTVYSSAQAFYVLREFFETHPPSDFSLVDVTGTGSSYFVQGQLAHSRADEPLQVYVRLVRDDAPEWKVREVRVDSDAE